MSRSTVFRTIAVASFRKGHFRPLRRILELRKTLFYDNLWAAVGIITPLGSAIGAAPSLIIIPTAAQIKPGKGLKTPYFTTIFGPR